MRCYRGIAKDNPQYLDALRGIAKPVGGPATPEEHNEGETRSEYTSWTTDRQVAREKAQDQELGSHGIVLQKDFDASELISSPDAYQESEVLIKGLVTDAVIVEVI